MTLTELKRLVAKGESDRLEFKKSTGQRTVETAIRLGRMEPIKDRHEANILRGFGLLVNGRLLNAAVALYGKSDDHLEVTNPGTFHFGLNADDMTRPHPSKPWNPLIASVFYRAGVIEQWGIGTLNILDWCKENGNLPPRWEEQRTGDIIVTFWPIPSAAKLKPTEQVTPQLGQLILACKQPLTRVELQTALKLGDREHFRKTYLLPALAEGWIERTIPDKPQSRLQKYRLTDKGRAWLAARADKKEDTP